MYVLYVVSVSIYLLPVIDPFASLETSLVSALTVLLSACILTEEI